MIAALIFCPKLVSQATYWGELSESRPNNGFFFVSITAFFRLQTH